MVLFFVQSFVQSFVILLVTISNFFSSPPTSLSVSWPNLSEPFVQLFQSVNNGDLFVLEPSLMLDAIQKVNKQRRISTVETEEHLCWLSKRFHLPSFVQWNSNSSLTVGVFADQWKNVQGKIAPFKETGRIIGQIPIYEDKSTNSSQSILHIFFANHNANSSRIFRLHIVFVYRSEHFLWIGATKDDQQAGNFSSLEPAALKSFSANHEQIFDSFSVQAVNGLYFADDIEHLLSQLPTSRYLHCPQQRNKQWMASNNHLKENDLLSSFYLESIVNMKRLMRQQQMEFFMISGTLLGWHRACHATPYTDDADFGSWGKYLIDEPPRENWLRGNISNAGFRLFKSFGHLEDSLEYTFQFKRLYLNSVWFKTDLFFTYLDGATSVIRMPLHSPEAGLVGYLNFTRFDLCSGVLFGYKLLTPCTPEKTITEEYGKDWSQPITKWNYITASQNLDKWVRWNRSSPQVTYRSTFWEELFSVFNFF